MENFTEKNLDNPVDIFEEIDFDIREHDKQIRQARNTIFIVAAIQFLFGIVSGYQIGSETGWLVFAVTGFIAIIFLALGIWTKKKPYTAILIALILYSSLLAIDLIIQPSTVLKGIIIKLFIIGYLIRGLGKAKEAQHWAQAFRK